VFDCDGTLADTEPLADIAWREALADHGYRATDDDFRAVIGSPYERTFAYFAARAPLGDPAGFRPQVRERFRRLLDERLTLHDDAAATLRALVGDGVPVGVASSSSSDHVHRILERSGIAELVTVVVGADDVTDHKPHPEPYLAATAALGAAPERCAAVEDTPVGIEAARAAGLFTVAVLRGPFDRAQLGRAHRVVERVTPASLSTPQAPAG
jgi:HAD superfamily hydrolase (TIGR01509 family)